MDIGEPKRIIEVEPEPIPRAPDAPEAPQPPVERPEPVPVRPERTRTSGYFSRQPSSS
jgi:hypothetical protein